MPENPLLGPGSVVQQAIKAVPAVKYALGIGGIVAVIAIASTFGISANAAIFGTVIMLVLMVVLVVFASLVRKPGQQNSLPALVFTWFGLLLFMATAVLLFTSAFWAKPLDLKAFETPAKPTPAPSAVAEKSAPESSPVPQKISPERAEHNQVTSSPLEQEAHAWEQRGDKAAFIAITIEYEEVHHDDDRQKPPYTEEELKKIDEVIVANFKQARTAWTNAFNTAATKQYKAALQMKLKGGGGSLTCELPDDDHAFCYPNGSDLDVLDLSESAAPRMIKHHRFKP
jgi:hypothetical protein